MDEEKAYEAMREAMASQLLLVGFFQALSKTPAFVPLIKQAFDYADHVAEVGAYKFGNKASAPYLTGLADILEQLRAATLPDHGKPKNDVIA